VVVELSKVFGGGSCQASRESAACVPVCTTLTHSTTINSHNNQQ
jgi:hypothetical protein